MELITFFLAFLGSLAAHFLAHDAYTSAPRYARRLIKWAAQRLPNDHQKRYLEEWLADLDERPTVISKFQHAFECCICARKMSAICSGWAVVPEQLVTFEVNRTVRLVSSASREAERAA